MSADPALLARFSVSDPKATKELGRQLARCLAPGDVLLLEGDLGAGKTTFVQGLAAGLGVTGPVTSPTFTLMRVLECPADRPVRRLLHADLYRLDHLKEVLDLGLLELVDDGAVAAVEWGDAGAPVLGDNVLEVRIERTERAERADLAEPDGVAEPAEVAEPNRSGRAQRSGRRRRGSRHHDPRDRVVEAASIGACRRDGDFGVAGKSTSRAGPRHRVRD